jgi:hypothetical protein
MQSERIRSIPSLWSGGCPSSAPVEAGRSFEIRGVGPISPNREDLHFPDCCTKHSRKQVDSDADSFVCSPNLLWSG